VTVTAMTKRWEIRSPNIFQQARLAEECSILPLTAQVLINRGLTYPAEVHTFLKASFDSLIDPLTLPDMGIAVERIKKAIREKEKVLVFGDYDADGITSCAILVSTFERLGLSVQYYIPHRIKEGYGLNAAIADFCRANGISLLIALDCGTSNIDEVKAIMRIGTDVIIVDHHEQMKGELPPACAVVNPKRSDSQYPFRDFSAAGLTYKLAQALTGQLLTGYLDLVTLGTIADVAPLSGENRIIVKAGLKALSSTTRPGLCALMEVARISGRSITPEHVSYILGPRINASGRMDTAHTSVQLLLSDSADEAQRLAQELNRNNQHRQKVESGILTEAEVQIETDINFKEHSVIILGKEGWHMGILGIVASKIADRYNRPTIIISFENDIGKGSCRSIDNFHILDALSRCSQHLEDFGGHRYAAGLTIARKHFDAFKESINRIASTILRPEDYVSALSIDAEIGLDDLSDEFLHELERLEPFGEGNPQPVFSSRGLVVKSAPSIVGRDTLKLWLSDGVRTYQAIGFGMGKYMDLVSTADAIDVAYGLSFDRWQGSKNIQLNLKDIRVSQR
jgi:single-stranded-DNA-specific exonuclease